MILKVLGSVSPFPCGDKNGVSYLIKSEEKNEKILLDTGPASTRFLDMEKDLNNLTIIISHLHKDHYSDLSAIAYASFVNHNLGFLENKIKVYIPKDESLMDYKYLMNYGKENYLEFIPYDNLQTSIGGIDIKTVKNPHDVLTFSIRLEDGRGSLVYSSDTGYKDNNLVDFAKDAGLLICEATFLKGQQRIGNNHLYAFEAGRIAKASHIQNLMLTHFYPTIPKKRYVDEAKEEFFKDCIYIAEENDKYLIRKDGIDHSLKKI